MRKYKVSHFLQGVITSFTWTKYLIRAGNLPGDAVVGGTHTSWSKSASMSNSYICRVPLGSGEVRSIGKLVEGSCHLSMENGGERRYTSFEVLVHPRKYVNLGHEGRYRWMHVQRNWNDKIIMSTKHVLGDYYIKVRPSFFPS